MTTRLHWVINNIVRYDDPLLRDKAAFFKWSRFFFIGQSWFFVGFYCYGRRRMTKERENSGILHRETKSNDILMIR